MTTATEATATVQTDPDLSTLSLPGLLVFAAARQKALPDLPGVRQAQAEPDQGALRQELRQILVLRRALADQLLRTSGAPDENTPERQALYMLMSLCREEGLREGRLYAALRQAWLTRMTGLTGSPGKQKPPPSEHPDAPTGPLPETRSGWQMQRDQLERRIEKLQEQIGGAQGRPSGRKKTSPRLNSQDSPARQAELLAALRARDDALAAQDRLEERLSRVTELYGDDVLAHRLGTPSNRERENLLSHFRRRLKDHFNLNLSYAEVSALDRQLRLQTITHRTNRGTPIKQVQIAGQSVYAVLTPDRGGDLTLTTAYSARMLSQISGF